jgi:hypothetical protein
MNIPRGKAHLQLIARTALEKQVCSSAIEAEADKELIGTALCALYEAATCNRKCHGGGHVLESLCGRMYNLGASAYLLICTGFYDEAMNLTRSIGEAGNLVGLSVVDKVALREWLQSDKKTRMKKFSPSEVRKALQRHGARFVIADDDWYSRFCERYTHIGPETKPNMHNPENQPTVGGVLQEDGFKNALGELTTALGMTALLICRYFGFTDLFDEISKIAGKSR